MNKKFTKIGVFGGLSALALSMINGGDSNAQYRNFADVPMHDVRYTLPGEFMTKSLYFLPTESIDNIRGLSVTENVGGEIKLIKPDKNDYQIVKENSIVDFFAGEVINSPEKTESMNNLTVFIPDFSRHPEWRGNFIATWRSNEISGGVYTDKISIISPDERKTIEIYDKGRDGIANKLRFYQRDEFKEWRLAGDVDLDAAEGDLQKKVSLDKDRILRIMEDSHNECSTIYCVDKNN